MIYLNLELTDRCNLRCTMCGQALAGEVHAADEHLMSRATWSHLLEGLADVPDEVSLCPHWLGEPTVHPEFAAMITEAFERNAGNRLFRHFKLHTNGVLLDRDHGVEVLLDCAARADQREDTFQFVHMSLDALSPEVYRAVKGAPGRQRAYANTEHLLRRRAERGLRWPRVTVAFVVMPGNRGEAGAFLDHWRRVFDELGDGAVLTSDWPDGTRDAIYFRRLNWDDQEAADALHRSVIRELGLPPHPADSGAGPRSF